MTFEKENFIFNIQYNPLYTLYDAQKSYPLFLPSVANQNPFGFEDPENKKLREGLASGSKAFSACWVRQK
jgi:hypothetical protein